MIHPYEIKRRQLAVARETRRVEGEQANEERRSRFLFTRIGLIQGLALYLAIGLVTGEWRGSEALIVPSAIMAGILFDVLRAA